MKYLESYFYDRFISSFKSSFVSSSESRLVLIFVHITSQIWGFNCWNGFRISFKSRKRKTKDSILCVRLFLFTSSFHDIIAITCTQFSHTFRMIFHSLLGNRQHWQEDCSREYGTLMKYWDTAGKHHLVAA